MSENYCKVVIVGDEILSGKRKDSHLSKSIELLGANGGVLQEARYLPDDLAFLTRNFQETLASGATVFSFGGIGGTPDDYTRQAVAAALEVPLEAHPEGVAILESKFGKETYPHRIKMVEFPRGAKLIPNPFNQIPGFAIHQHYFLPGFPNMAWPMMEWVLQTYYPQWKGLVIEASLLVDEAPEGRLIPLMEEVVSQFPGVKLFSLPRFKEQGGHEIELGVKGKESSNIEAAIAHIQKGLDSQGYRWTRLA